MPRLTGPRRRVNARKSIWKDDDGTEYRVVLWTKLDGRRGVKRCGLPGDPDAEEMADELVAKFNDDPTYDETSLGRYAIKILQGWAENVGDADTQMPPSTFASYSSIVEKIIGPRARTDGVFTPLATLRLDDVRQSDISRWAGSLRRRNGMPYSLSSIGSHVAVVSRILTTAVTDTLVRQNAAHGFMRTKKVNKRRGHGVSKAIKTRQLVAFLSIAEGDPECARVHDYVSLAGWLGLRVGEAHGLMWSDIDKQSPQIHVCRQMVAGRKGWPSRVKALKQSKAFPERWVALSGSLITWLTDHKREQQEQALRDGRTPPRYILGVEPENYVSAIYHLNCQIKSVIARMDENERPTIKVGTHTFRHTRAVSHLEKGGDMKKLQLLLGHARFNTTDTYYGDLAPEADPLGAAVWDATLDAERETLARLRRGSGTK
jgi:integrase